MEEIVVDESPGFSETFAKTFYKCELDQDLIAEIYDLDILDFLENSPGLVLAGGALRKILVQEDVIDYDFFFTEAETVFSVSSDLVNLGFKCEFACPKMQLFTYIHPSSKVKVQLILNRFYDNLLDVVKHFDIDAGACATDGREIVFSSSFINSVLEKKVRINHVSMPVSTMKRIGKYLHKGYSVDTVEYEGLVNLIRRLPPEWLDMRWYLD